MELSKESRHKILSYLRTTTALKDIPLDRIISHIAKLEACEQLEAEEDINGRLVYAVGWWKLTDKAVEDMLNNIPPKRYNRGRNIVGLFWLIPNEDLGIMQMRRIVKRICKMERATSLHIWTPRDKWFCVRLSPSQKPWQRMKRSKVNQVMRVLSGS